MFAIYNNVGYAADYTDGKCVLITNDKSKTDNSFEDIGGVFTKTIDLSDPKLKSFYFVGFSVFYDAGIKNNPDKWRLDLSDIWSKKRQVDLLYWHGALDGCDVPSESDGNACYKTVSFDDLPQCLVKYVYYKKNGEVYQQGSLVIHAKLTPDEMGQIRDYLFNLIHD